MFNYNELKDAINRCLPEEFKTDFFKRKIYNYSCPEFLYNYDPYKRNGELLPDEIRLVGKKDGLRYVVEDRGREWFLYTLLRIYANDYQDLLPAAFIFVFLRQFIFDIDFQVNNINKDWNIYSRNIYEAAGDELKSKRIPMPYNATKHYIAPSGKAFDNIADLLEYDDKRDELNQIISDAERFAKLIVDTVGSITEEFDYEYWSYPESEYKKAAQYQVTAIERVLKDADVIE